MWATDQTIYKFPGSYGVQFYRKSDFRYLEVLENISKIVDSFVLLTQANQFTWKVFIVRVERVSLF